MCVKRQLIVPFLTVVVFCLLSRTLFAQPFNVRTYGATPDDATDDTAAFVAALAAAPVSGAELYVPAGTYNLSATLNLGARSITIRGEGQRVTRLRWTADVHGIVYASTVPNQTLTVRSLSLITTAGSASAAAIVASWPRVVGFHGENGFISTSITDVHIGGEVLGSDWWFRGIFLFNAIGSKISNFVITGWNGTVASSGIDIYGLSLGIYINQGDIWGVTFGVRAEDENEGLHITDVEVSEAYYGYYINTSHGTPGTVIEGCHANTRSAGIVLNNRGDMAVSNNLLYRLGNDPYVGIHVVNGSWNRITGNYIVPISGVPGTNNTNGIVIEGNSVNNMISSNVTRNQDTGVWLVGSGANYNTVVGNQNVGFVVSSTLNQGVGNFIATNNPY